MMFKKCIKCLKDKPESDFHFHPEMKSGRSNRCKECVSIQQKERLGKLKNDIGWLEKSRARARKYYWAFGFTKKVSIETRIKYKNKFPEKIKAMKESQSLKRPLPGVEKHHWSYKEEHIKDIIWLPKRDHMKAHRFIIYDQERRMYRRFDNNQLLDSKEIHEMFVLECVKTKTDY